MNPIAIIEGYQFEFERQKVLEADNFSSMSSVIKPQLLFLMCNDYNLEALT